MKPTQMTEDRRIERLVGATLLSILAIGCLVVLRPFLSALLWAVVLSTSTWPIYARIEHLLGGRRTFAAAVVTALAAILFLLPLVALVMRLAPEVTQLTDVVSRWMERGPPQPPSWVRTLPLVGGNLDTYWQSVAHDSAKLTTDLRTYVGSAKDWILSIGVSLGSGMTDLVLSLMISFFCYRDGMMAVRALSSILGRIGGNRAEHLLAVAGKTMKGVVYGLVGTNLIEALLATLGLWVAGVPGELFLGFALFFLTLIPFAPLVVFVPAIVWLVQQDAMVSAILLTAWYVLIFMILEGVLRAYFMSRGGNLPLILVFLGVLGGIIAFGLLGIFVGPTLLAVGYALVQDWSAGINFREETGDREAIPVTRPMPD